MNVVRCKDQASCWAKVVDPFLSKNEEFRKAKEKQQQANIPFSARLFVPDEHHELRELPENFHKLLSQFDIPTEIEEGINKKALKDPSVLRDIDVIVVLGVTEDLRTFALELARDKGTASRMIACIPSGDESKIYYRRLRETYGVETVAVCSGAPSENQNCRCGVELLKHCVDRFVDKVTVGHKAHMLQNTTVLLIHGIRTRALWQGEVSKTIRDAGLLPCPSNYEKLDVLRFLLPGMWLKKGVIKRVEDEVEAAKKNPDVNLAVLAHSFGTFILGKLLMKGDHKFDRIVLCGSVLPSNFQFREAEGRFKAIINEVSDHDVWPLLAQKIGWNYGATGTFGFNRGNVRDRVHAGKKHSCLLNGESCNQYWTPFFCGGDISPTAHETPRPAKWLQVIDAVPAPIVKVIFWIGLPWLAYQMLMSFL